ncbi:MAG: hypothetical protein Ta2B_16360 [Termitinemataceae bacterium]|nr:MAG: hypothetical protein Ta2B_16360 [Termitinemataceae bacterium]
MKFDPEEGPVGAKFVTITIPNTVVEIGHSAFRESSRLTNIIIPDSVTHIDMSAFVSCTSLKTIILPDDIKIEMYVFFDCPKLDPKIKADIIKRFGDGVFANPYG